LNEQGEPSSETRKADDVGASTTSSEEDVDKLASDVEQKCSTEQVASAGDGDQPQRKETAQEPVTSEVTDKTDSGKEILETPGKSSEAEDPEITFKKPSEPGTEQADVANSDKVQDHDLNRNSKDISSDSKTTTCCSA